MAIPATPPRARSGRFAPSGRVVLGLLFGSLMALLVSARAIAGLYTDWLWFGSLELRSVWTNLLGTKIGLASLSALVFVAVLVPNALLAHRQRRPSVPRHPADEIVELIRRVVDRRPLVAWAGAGIVLSLPFAGAATGHWDEWILFRNHVSFGVDDPQFGRDVGFYVFRLPFLTFLTDWLFGAVVVVSIVTAGAHYLNGGIRLPTDRGPVPGGMFSAAVKAHLSVLFAVLALLKAASYWLDRYELTLSTRGVVRGASYTDVTAQLPAIQLLMLISVLAAGLFLYNIRRRGWLVPVVAVTLWGIVAVVVGGVYPALIQRFRVEPAESTREAEYIARNIEATRSAMGLDKVAVKPFAYDEELSAETLQNNVETIRNVRLWDPLILRRTYQRLQEVRTFYRFTDVDIDRYMVQGNQTQIVLSARELNPDSLPSDTWENRHLAFTHGYGAVLSPANAVTSDGQPDFLVKNIPPQGEPRITQPRLYHGEAIGGYAIVNSGRDEIDYLKEDGTAVTNRYDGTGGIGVGSVARRLAFALRFGDINPLISGFMTGDSKILYMRDIRQRVEKIAPFLRYDADPYPVVIDGRITWLIDAYTTSDRYPYAQQADASRLPEGSGLGRDFNYIRNSVKVAIDAYDGDATFYVVDPKDPIAAAYAKAFPDLFTSGDQVPDDLRAHFRYPEDMFRVQTNMWGRYHIGDPKEFYSQSDRWNIAQDPGASGEQAPPGPAGPAGQAQGRMDPYYLQMRLPGDPSTEFLILQPFVPFSEDDSRRELSAFMVAKSDPDDYGSLEVFVMPRDRQVDGPAIVSARINQEPEVSQLITLLSRAGSEVLQGNLLVIPIEQSLIYIRPLYVQATGANAVPELKKVVVAFGDRIAIHDTLQAALASVFGDAPETLEEGPPGAAPGAGGGGGEDGLSGEARRLLDDAARAFAAADAALTSGDAVEYVRRLQEGRRLFNEAREAGAGEGSGASTTTPPAPTTTTPPGA